VAGFLRFLAFFVLLGSVFVLLVLPFLVSPLLTQMVRDAGLRSATLDVTVAALDPTLLLGRSRQVTLNATDVDADPVRIGHVNVALRDASYFDRSFASVSGELGELVLDVGGEQIEIATIRLEGPAEAANATALLNARQTEQMIRFAGRRVGVEVSRVTVSDSGVTVSVSGLEAQGRVTVQGGALLLDPGVGGAIVLLQPAPSDPWSLSEAWISSEGLNIRGSVDVNRVAASLE
jgi:hypothetical protein